MGERTPSLQGKRLPVDTPIPRPEFTQMPKKQVHLISPSNRDEETYSILFKLEGFFFNNLIKTNLCQQLTNYNLGLKHWNK